MRMRRTHWGPWSCWLVGVVVVLGGCADAPTPNGPQVLRPLDQESLRVVVHEHAADVQACYRGALARNPASRGDMTLAFTIADRGYVVDSEVLRTDMTDPGMARCMEQEIASWVFPAPPVPQTHELTFAFERSGGQALPPISISSDNPLRLPRVGADLPTPMGPKPAPQRP